MICTPHKRGKDQFNIFLKLAVKGDKIFLHTKGMVTHVGEFTGDIRRGPPENGDEKLDKMRIIKNGVEGKGGIIGTSDDENFIIVSGWKKLNHPFKGMGKYKTLYEAPEYMENSFIYKKSKNQKKKQKIKKRQKIFFYYLLPHFRNLKFIY